jgi:MoaA/NifB/PqqE/SkfB family radical SAM enzyme|tara:strand:+ start:1415 stop:2257 length:843 start_codon:yes stop_codon:yes gene_type:complete
MMSYQQFINTLDQLVDIGECEEIYLEGSGEPTMNKRLPDFVKAGSDRGFKMSFITNGFWFKNDLMKKTIDAGMHFARVSVTGYDQKTYEENMSKDAFYQVMDNANAAIEYGGNLGSYSLILDNDNIAEEVRQYRENWIDHVPGIKASIWKMHNWSGQLGVDWREGKKKRSCGRPFSPDLIVRAGGNDKKTGAVVPCCMVLGQDSKAVLGHLSEESIMDIWHGEKYNELRRAHEFHDFDSIEYCKNCDMLYDAPDALVWSNFDADYNTLTGSTFTMEKYRI